MSDKIEFGPIKSVFYPDENAHALEIRVNKEIHRTDYWLVVCALDEEFSEKKKITPKEMCIKFGEWLQDSNWGEKETWGKHDPPSIPTMDELYHVFYNHITNIKYL